MVKFCLGQRLDMLIKPMLYSHSAKLKNVEICKMTRGFPITSNPSHFSCIYSTSFTKHLLCARLCPGHWGLQPHAAPPLTPWSSQMGQGVAPAGRGGHCPGGRSMVAQEEARDSAWDAGKGF